MSVGSTKTISLRVPSEIYDRALACFPATDPSGFGGRIRELVEAAILVAEKGNDPVHVLHEFNPVLANRAIKAEVTIKRLTATIESHLERLEAATPFLLTGLGVTVKAPLTMTSLPILEKLDLLTNQVAALCEALEAAHSAAAQIELRGGSQ